MFARRPTIPIQRKAERWNKSIKSECIRPGVPLPVDDAERLIGQYVTVYNEQRLHSSLGCITPLARLQGRQHEIHAARDRKLERAGNASGTYEILVQARRSLSRHLLCQ
jgi:hypothetical protein